MPAPSEQVAGFQLARQKKKRYAIICCGSREDRDVHDPSIKRRLGRFPVGTIVIHGGMTGVDSAVHRIALSLRMHPVPIFYFFEMGRGGGPRRNECMLDLLSTFERCGYKCGVEAWPGRSGTASMLKLAAKHSSVGWIKRNENEPSWLFDRED